MPPPRAPAPDHPRRPAADRRGCRCAGAHSMPCSCPARGPSAGAGRPPRTGKVPIRSSARSWRRTVSRTGISDSVSPPPTSDRSCASAGPPVSGWWRRRHRARRCGGVPGAGLVRRPARPQARPSPEIMSMDPRPDPPAAGPGSPWHGEHAEPERRVELVRGERQRIHPGAGHVDPGAANCAASTNSSAPARGALSQCGQVGPVPVRGRPVTASNLTDAVFGEQLLEMRQIQRAGVVRATSSTRAGVLYRHGRLFEVCSSPSQHHVWRSAGSSLPARLIAALVVRGEQAARCRPVDRETHRSGPPPAPGLHGGRALPGPRATPRNSRGTSAPPPGSVRTAGWGRIVSWRPARPGRRPG